MHSLVIIASCLISFAALSPAHKRAKNPLQSVQAVDQLKKNAAQALERLKSTLKQAEDQSDDIVEKSIFRHHADIIHQNALDAFNGNFSLAQHAMEVLKLQNPAAEEVLKCLAHQHARIAEGNQGAVEMANDIVAEAISKLKSNVRTKSEKYHVTGLLEQIKQLNAGIDDVDSYLDAIKIIINNLDLPIKIVKSTVEYVDEKETSLTAELEESLRELVPYIDLALSILLTDIHRCVDQ